MFCFLHSLRPALRGLLRTPGFTAVALLTLALGIGASTAVFSVLQTLFLRPLPFHQDHRLVQVTTADPNKNFPGSGHLQLSAPAYRDIEARQQVFSSVAVTQRMGVTLTGSGQAERLLGLRVTGSYFPTLGVRPLLGRLLQPSDDQAAPAVVLSHQLWSQRWGADPSMVGKSIVLDGTSRVVVGVLSPTFMWPGKPQVFLNAGPTPEEIQGARGTLAFFGVARLKPQVSLGQATQAMEALGKTLASEIPDAKEWGIGVAGLREALYGDRRQSAGFLLLTGLSVLVIACANLGNLLLSRAAARQRELALRKALGAGWSGLLKPFLADALVLSLGGGALGVLLAWGLSGMLRPYIPAELLASFRLDLRLLVFALGLSLLTALIAGLVPALLFARLDPARSLQSGGRGNSSGTQGWLRHGLVGAQVALTLTLLVSFGALWRSLSNLQKAHLGYEVDQALAFLVRPNPAKYPEETQQIALYRSLLQGIAQLPGVQAVGSTSDTPLNGGSTGDYLVPGRETEKFNAHYRSMTPDAFKALGIPLLQGRAFLESDFLPKLNCVIVSRALANRAWPGQDPIGKTVAKHLYGPTPTPLQVVGVVEDVRHQGPGSDKDLDTIYFPGAGEWIVVRTAGNPMALVSSLREVVKTLDPDLPLAALKPLRATLDLHLEADRNQTTLLGLLAAIALLLAAAGIYGVMAHSVTQRTREIGIRKALGGQNVQVVWEIARRGLVMTAFGLGGGALLTLGLGRLLTTQVYGVSATDPLFVALASLVLGLVALAAALIPATRAARVQPAVALRAE